MKIQLLFKNDPTVHNYDVASVETFVEQVIGGVEAAVARGITILHEDFEAMLGATAVPTTDETATEEPTTDVTETTTQETGNAEAHSEEAQQPTQD